MTVQAYRWGIFFALVVMAWSLLVTPGAMAQQGQKIELSLYSLNDDSLLYRGSRTISEAEGKVNIATTFTTPAGKPIQETVAVYEKVGLVPVSYKLEDMRFGETETLIRKGGEIELRYREDKDEDEDVDTVDWEPGSLFTATVEAFIHLNWSTLKEGKELAFPFLVPSRQDVYTFRVLLDEERTLQQQEFDVIRMEPDSWLVRRLVDPLYFLFSRKEPRRLMEYHGRSSLRDDQGEPQDLRMTYSYLGQG